MGMEKEKGKGIRRETKCESKLLSLFAWGDFVSSVAGRMCLLITSLSLRITSPSSSPHNILQTQKMTFANTHSSSSSHSPLVTASQAFHRNGLLQEDFQFSLRYSCHQGSFRCQWKRTPAAIVKSGRFLGSTAEIELRRETSMEASQVRRAGWLGKVVAMTQSTKMCVARRGCVSHHQ